MGGGFTVVLRLVVEIMILLKLGMMESILMEKEEMNRRHSLI
jgi:hypothetical protein